MKIKDLMNKNLRLDMDSFGEEDLDIEIDNMTINTKDKDKAIKVQVHVVTHETENSGISKDSLESLGYSFEVGV